MIAAFTFAATITSCQDYDNGYDTDKILLQQNYKDSFHALFGDIAPDQNWGFYPIPVCGAEATTRTTNTNMNQWESEYHLDVPGGLENDGNANPWGWTKGDVTNYERAYVYWWFSTHKNPTRLTGINWRNYFIENVWGQPEHSGLYSNGSVYSETTQYGMDYLNVWETNLYSNITGWEHINDFNAGGSSKEQVMYQYSSSTENFQYHASYDSNDYANWTLQYINGNYYLAFDYEHHKDTKETNGVIEPDGYYNDWILKLTPGLHKADEYTRRIMCEDLGNTWDIDFNDVVFDVSYVQDGGTDYLAIITVQACLGKLPIYIEGKEVHELFGVGLNQFVNCEYGQRYTDDIDIVKRPAAIFAVHKATNNPKDIVVKVKTETADWVTLNAELGKASQKLACPATTKWMKERNIITSGYTKFNEYVNNGPDLYRDTKGDGWTTDNVDAGYIYQESAMGGSANNNANIYHPSNWEGGQINQSWVTLWNNLPKDGEGTPTNYHANANGQVTFASQRPENPTGAEVIVISPRVIQNSNH